MEKSDARSVELKDPRALRALAHPTRLRLLTLLRTVGSLTASQAAERTGESAGSCSFHFRQLSTWGLVEEAGGGRGRERPWRATAQFTSVSRVADTRESAEASRLFTKVVAAQYFELLSDWIDAEDREPPKWQEASQFSDVMMFLSAEELAGVTRAISDLLRDAAVQFGPRAHPPEGARMVQFVTLAHPVFGFDPMDVPR
ncbi:ArsR-family transcriptional regulator [mine drainage metagenome]|uniref:ArsR-family transcriptional regulator n=1 Tax=mine drainage metagenome TaxID=410659 RepID=T0ZHH8_9ZZZZ